MHRLTTSIAVLAAAAIAVTACSSSGGGGGGTSTGAGTTSAGSTSSGGGGDAGVEAAKAATEKNLQEPTTIPQTTPLDSKPPTGKTFVWLKCDVNQCADLADGFKAATAALGWTYKELTYKTADRGRR